MALRRSQIYFEGLHMHPMRKIFRFKIDSTVFFFFCLGALFFLMDVLTSHQHPFRFDSPAVLFFCLAALSFLMNILTSQKMARPFRFDSSAFFFAFLLALTFVLLLVL